MRYYRAPVARSSDASDAAYWSWNGTRLLVVHRVRASRDSSLFAFYAA